MNAGLVLRRLVVTAWMPLLVVAVIWIATTQVRSPFFPPLPVVLASFWKTWLGAGFAEHVVPSMLNLGAGISIALVLGIGVGVVLATFPFANALVNPYAQFLRALPGVALLPLMLMLMGTNDGSKIALIAFGALWPILLNTIDGIRSIAPEQRDSARAYRVTPFNVVFRVLLPGAFPRITVGIRLSISIALVLMVGSEYYGATHGIGFYVLQAKQTFKTADMWSGVLLLGLIGYVLSTAYTAVERRILRWRPTEEK